MCFLLDYYDNMILLLLIDAYQLKEVSQYHKTPSGAKCTLYFYGKVPIAHPKASQNLNHKVRRASPYKFREFEPYGANCPPERFRQKLKIKNQTKAVPKNFAIIAFPQSSKYFPGETVHLQYADISGVARP